MAAISNTRCVLTMEPRFLGVGMAGMFVNLRKKPGLVTAGYIIDLKWLPQTNCIDGKNVC